MTLKVIQGHQNYRYSIGHVSLPWPVLISSPAEDRMLSWPECLVTCHTKTEYLQMVTRLSTDRAGCRVTWLM